MTKIRRITTTIVVAIGAVMGTAGAALAGHDWT